MSVKTDKFKKEAVPIIFIGTALGMLDTSGRYLLQSSMASDMPFIVIAAPRFILRLVCFELLLKRYTAVPAAATTAMLLAKLRTVMRYHSFFNRM